MKNEEWHMSNDKKSITSKLAPLATLAGGLAIYFAFISPFRGDDYQNQVKTNDFIESLDDQADADLISNMEQLGIKLHLATPDEDEAFKFMTFDRDDGGIDIIMENLGNDAENKEALMNIVEGLAQKKTLENNVPQQPDGPK